MDRSPNRHFEVIYPKRPERKATLKSKTLRTIARATLTPWVKILHYLCD